MTSTDYLDMALARPPVLPERFNGGRKWDKWVYYFKSVANVYGWNEAQSSNG